MRGMQTSSKKKTQSGMARQYELCTAWRKHPELVLIAFVCLLINVKKHI
jgi:hypothetical protein